MRKELRSEKKFNVLFIGLLTTRPFLSVSIKKVTCMYVHGHLVNIYIIPGKIKLHLPQRTFFKL